MEFFDKKGFALFVKVNKTGRYSRCCVRKLEGYSLSLFDRNLVVWVHRSLLLKYGYTLHEYYLMDSECIAEAIKNNGRPLEYDKNGKSIKVERVNLNNCKDTIQRFLQAGHSIRMISKKLNCSFEAVRRRCHEWGFESCHKSLRLTAK